MDPREMKRTSSFRRLSLLCLTASLLLVSQTASMRSVEAQTAQAVGSPTTNSVGGTLPPPPLTLPPGITAPPATGPTSVPVTTSSSQYINTYTQNVQASYCGGTTGDTYGAFKLFYIDDGMGGTLKNDGLSGVNINVGTQAQCASWVQGLAQVFKAGAAFADATIFNGFWIAFGATISILTALMMLWSGNAVMAASVLWRGALAITFTPFYAWTFIRIHNTFIYVNNSITTRILDPVYNNNQWNASNWVSAISGAIVDTADGILGLPITLVFGIIHKLYIVGLNVLVIVLFIWGAISIMGSIFGGFGTQLFRAWGKSTVLVYFTYLLWNIAAAFASVLMRANAGSNIALYWAAEAAYPLIPALLSAIASGGNGAGLIPGFAQGTVNNGMAVATTALGIAEGLVTGNWSSAAGSVKNAGGSASNTGGSGGGGGGSGGGGTNLPPSSATGDSGMLARNGRSGGSDMGSGGNGGGGSGNGGGGRRTVSSNASGDSGSLNRGGRNDVIDAEFTPVNNGSPGGGQPNIQKKGTASGATAEGGNGSVGGNGGGRPPIITPMPSDLNTSLATQGSGSIVSSGGQGSTAITSTGSSSGGGSGQKVEAYEMVSNNVRSAAMGILGLAMKQAAAGFDAQGAHVAAQEIRRSAAGSVVNIAGALIPSETKRKIDAELMPAEGFNTGWASKGGNSYSITPP